VGAVDRHLQAAQIELVGKRALAEFDVTPGGVVDAARFAQTGRLHASHGGIEPRLDLGLDRIGQLGAVGGEELDAVIVVRVVRRGNHDPRLQPQRAGEVSDGRRRHGAREHHVDTGGGEPGFEGGLQHVAGDSRVLADKNRRTLAGGQALARDQGDTRGVAQAHDKLGGNRGLPHPAADAVGAEVLSCHAFP
jgi:hypothetical protein